MTEASPAVAVQRFSARPLPLHALLRGARRQRRAGPARRRGAADRRAGEGHSRRRPAARARSSCAAPTSFRATGRREEATREALRRRLAAHRRPRPHRQATATSTSRAAASTSSSWSRARRCTRTSSRTSCAQSPLIADVCIAGAHRRRDKTLVTAVVYPDPEAAARRAGAVSLTKRAAQAGPGRGRPPRPGARGLQARQPHRAATEPLPEDGAAEGRARAHRAGIQLRLCGVGKDGSVNSQNDGI